MNIGNILRTLLNQPVAFVLEDGRSIIEVINERLPADGQLSVTATTGGAAMAALQTLPLDDRKAILSIETDCSIESTGQSAADALRAFTQRQTMWKILVVLTMTFLVSVTILVYSYGMYIVAVEKLELPSSDQIALVVAVPGGIIWAWFGVLSKENRDYVAATLGEIPKVGIGGALIELVTRSRNKPTPPPPDDTRMQ